MHERYQITTYRKGVKKYRVKFDNGWDGQRISAKKFILQYAYKNKVQEIATYENIWSVELFAYCDTHFILKNSNNDYFLVDMAKRVITNIPAQLLFSKGMNLTIEGQTLKVCQSTNCISINRFNND